MQIGTCHFVSLDAAIAYYRPYGLNNMEVISKWKNLEICIGAPQIKKGQSLKVNSEGRYIIEDWLDRD